jgi:hypothetical protein
MSETVREGVVEIETLRRFGRVPVGTRADCPISLVKYDVRTYWVHCTIRIADDPREMGISCMFNWGNEKTMRVQRHVRGVWKRFVGSMADYALSSIVDAVEGMNTKSGYQRFRVIRAQWNQG